MIGKKEQVSHILDKKVLERDASSPLPLVTAQGFYIRAGTEEKTTDWGGKREEGNRVTED